MGWGRGEEVGEEWGRYGGGEGRSGVVGWVRRKGRSEEVVGAREQRWREVWLLAPGVLVSSLRQRIDQRRNFAYCSFKSKMNVDIRILIVFI